MVRDKPLLDRSRALQDDLRRRRCARLLELATSRLAPDEVLGRPVRRQNDIVIPILRRPPAVRTFPDR